MGNLYKSSKGIFARFANLIKPQSTNWRGDAGQWINDALGDLDCASNLKLHTVSTNVVNHRFRLPSKIKSLHHLEYKGERLANFSKNGSEYYSIDESQPLYIRTSFETGVINIVYYLLNTDDEGLPLVPNVTGNDVDNYLFWYILKNWLINNTHPIFKYHEIEAKIDGPKGRIDLGLAFAARNALNRLSADDMEALKDSTVGLYKDNDRYENRTSNTDLPDDPKYLY